MKSLIIIMLLIFLAEIQGQTPVSQMEGFLELYLHQDTTSLYLGKSAGINMSSQLGNFHNTFLGFRSGSENTGNHNSFFGADAGYSNTIGSGNSFFGSGVGSGNTIGNNNTFLGDRSGFLNSSGSNNTYLGAGAGNTVSGSNNICIGAFSGPVSPLLGQSRLFIDVEKTNTPLIYGEFDNDLVRINGSLDVKGRISIDLKNAVAISGNFEDDLVIKNTYTSSYAVVQLEGGNGGKLWMFPDGKLYANNLGNIGLHKNMQWNQTTGEIGFDSSSRRYKTNISTLEDDWDKIMMTRPVKYTRPESPEYWEYGYIAEEMDSIGLRNLVGYDKDGKPDDVKYDRMVLYLTEVVKIQEKKIDYLTKELGRIKADQKYRGSFTEKNDLNNTNKYPISTTYDE